jgi:class 3 adenylate cyclase
MERYWKVLPGLLLSTHRFSIVEQAGELPVAREQRKLAAILAADVVGYSRLMGRDESSTLAR